MSSKSCTVEKEANILNEFCLDTTAHGFQHVTRGKHISYRIMWGLILVAVFGGSGYHLYELISSYLRYNYYTSITVDAETLKVSF